MEGLFPGRGMLFLLPDDEETGEALFRGAAGRCSILSVPPADWDRELTPWPAPALGKKRPPFAGAGRAYLQRLLALAEEASAMLPEPPQALGILGYSLGGLFSLWAACETGAFACAGSASGSLWYDGWCRYLAGHPCRARRVRLSLGEREPRARDPRMAAVGDCTEQTRLLLSSQGVDAALRWEQGGHFTEPHARLLRLLEELLPPLGV